MSVPPDQMMQGGPPGPPMGAPPPGMGMGGPPPSLLPFASTQPGGIAALAGPLLQQQQTDLDSFKQQQLEQLMGVVMQALQQAPNPLAQAAQTEPSAPLDGTQPADAADPSVMTAGDPGSDAYGGM